MAGIYSDIVDIVAPSSAVAGETVPVTIKVKNTYSAWLHVAAVGVRDSEERFIDWLKYWIPAGETHSFSGSFVMPYYPPGKIITIHAYTYYEDEDGNWRPDDEATKDVVLTAPPEVYEGTISRKELKYDNVTESIPVY